MYSGSRRHVREQLFTFVIEELLTIYFFNCFYLVFYDIYRNRQSTCQFNFLEKVLVNSTSFERYSF